MKIEMEIDVYYDFGATERINRAQLKDEVESAVCGQGLAAAAGSEKEVAAGSEVVEGWDLEAMEEGVGKENRQDPTSVINFEMCKEKR